MLTQLSQAEIWDQAITCGYAILLGAALCILYDTFRIHRIIKRPNHFMVFCEDLLFFTLASILTFCFLVVRCGGEFRLYVLGSALFGSIICRKSIGPVIFRLRLNFARKIHRIFHWFCAVILGGMGWFSRRMTGVLKKLKNILKRKKKPLENGTSVDV